MQHWKAYCLGEEPVVVLSGARQGCTEAAYGYSDYRVPLSIRAFVRHKMLAQSRGKPLAASISLHFDESIGESFVLSLTEAEAASLREHTNRLLHKSTVRRSRF